MGCIYMIEIARFRFLFCVDYHAPLHSIKILKMPAMSKLTMRCSILFCSVMLCLFSTPIKSVAQEVDFEVPTEINIIQGRLSVAFAEGVGEETAKKLITSLGYSTLQSAFYNLNASARSEKPLTNEELDYLRGHANIVEANQVFLDNQIYSTDPVQDSAFQRYNISLTFKSNTTQKEATQILKRLPTHSFTFAQKPSNEIVIEVGDQDETAITVLQGRDEVKWVTYVGVAGNN